MEVKIGVVYTPKELTLDVDGSADEMMDSVKAHLNDGAAMLWFIDRKGRRIGIPVDKVAYVEIGEEDEAKRVGFGPG